MKIQIQNYRDSSVIHEGDFQNIKDAIFDAIKRKIDLGNAGLQDADLSDADLSSANLRSANLRSASLRDADLSGANLSSANLRNADLRNADLRNADLRGANFNGANLSGANLSGAHLRGANFNGANLSSAHLRGANFNGANLSDIDIKRIVQNRNILPDGAFIGWKKLYGGTICKLQIPADSKRVGGIVGRKCRAEFAIVLEGEGYSHYDGGFQYIPGTTVKPDSFDPNPLIECSHGIHFFITREEAEAYYLF